MPNPFRLSVLLPAILAAGCASYDVPDNLEAVDVGDGYQAQYRDIDVARSDASFLRSAVINASKCLPFRGGLDADTFDGKGSGISAFALGGERLTRNDLVDIRVGTDETFNGNFVVSRDGSLKLPFLQPIRAQGRTTNQIEDDIARQLLEDEFYSERPRISVRIADFASVSVGVSGAVFEPRLVEIGGVPGDQVDARRQDALGASSEARNLSAALRAAGGVRPDADISAVEVRRGSSLYQLDMRGVFEGRNVVDIMLLTGDEIRVPSRQCFQEDLMRPSPISPPGVSLFLSNLTQPAPDKASTQAAQRRQPTVSRSTSADRSSVLFSRNPMTDVSVVIERDIEDLLRRADRDDFDPYLLPGDALACYDSTITNVTEIGRVTGIVGAAALLVQ